MPDKKKIFIVYASPEKHLADALKHLLDYWGLAAFYCKQEDAKAASHEPYRQMLREKLVTSDLVIFLISRSFQYSAYCQAEAGTTMALNLPRIFVKVPPVSSRDVETISPVLEGFNSLFTDSKFIDSILHLLDEMLAADVRRTRHDFNKDQLAEEEKRIAELQNAIQRAEDYYKYGYAKNVYRMGVWPSLGDEHARRSLVGNIKSSLRGSKDTNLTFVGVSLKFSLDILTQALTEYAAEVKPGGTTSRNKSVNIELIHMDDFSHILHTLNDTIDIPNIRENFRRRWSAIEQEWNDLCVASGLTLQKPKVRSIDYIPPRIGILIDNDKLYAGRCSVVQKGISYHLLVGEREYYFYSRDDSEGRGGTRIDEFTAILQTYRDRKHNSGWLVSDDDRLLWIVELQQYIKSCADDNITELKLISSTGQKFLPLVRPALDLGINVKIYIDRDAGAQVEASLERAIQQELRYIKDPSKCSITLHTYAPRSTFRAAVIGDQVIGVQMYVDYNSAHPNAESESGNSPVRMIIGSSSKHFAELNMMVSHFIASNCDPNGRKIINNVRATA